MAQGPSSHFCSICSPKFSSNKAYSGSNAETYGPDCFCDSPKLCVGCTCKRRSVSDTFCP